MLIVMADVVLGCKNLRSDVGTMHVGAVKIAERMVVIVVNAEIL